ncbi:efflux RND transporter periplasmic adaptor subunit [Rhodohalobacter halophilus]|uniref:efflux RND transporter periplasmic adaptor subunit n=1 Tax=Rhodohalobacter halophilus TaxID=1812810 RepID=UPI00083F68D5|nr:efflux RND transporter periplasmic adaptor subunit [Rhodohalobacter halophilus]
MNKMMNYVKKLLSIGMLSLLVIACGEPQENGEDNGPAGARLMPVETIVIESDDFEDFVRVSGTVEAIEDAMISAEISGRIMSIKERGERVEKGEVIAQIDDRLIQAQYEAAKTGYELAEDTFNRLESLYADSIVSTQDYNSARAQRDQAKSQLNQAEKQLQDSRIEAPFSGRIEERFIRTGELINPGMPVVRLVNTDRVRIQAGVPERYAGEITEGSRVELNFRALNEEPRTSRVTYAGNVLDPETRTFAIEVELNNSGQIIKPEMVVDLLLDRATLNDVIIVPRTAVLRNETGVAVFVAAEQNGAKVARMVDVQTGPSSGPLIQIVNGLETGDEMVISGVRNLSEGDELNILHTESSTERAQKLRSADRPVVSF